MGGVRAGVPGEAGYAAQSLTSASDSGAATVPVGDNQSLSQAAVADSGNA